MVQVPQLARIDRLGNQNTFTVPTQIQIDGLCLKTQALCDTGAEIRLAVSHAMAKKAHERLGAHIVKKSKPLRLSDYRRQPAGQATHELVASFEVDGRLFPRQKFLILDTGHDIFIGQDWLVKHDVWLHPKTRSFGWPEDRPALARYAPAIPVPRTVPKIDKLAQADAERRDRKIHQDSKIQRILTAPWRRPSAEEETVDISALLAQIQSDPRQSQWQKQASPTEAIPFKTGPPPSRSINSTAKWKTFDGKPIPFPTGEDPAHVRLVRDTLPERLAHLEGFFSKKASTKLPAPDPKREVVLELRKPLEGKPPSFRTPLGFLPLEKETVDELLRIDFIEPAMDENAASVLFVPKPHDKERRFCVDYRWLNQFLASRQVLAPDVDGTIANCRNAKRMTKIDIIRAFNRLLMHADSRYLTAFKTRQGTFRWKVLPFGLKVGPAWWQAFVNAQLNELLDLFASAYADDVLVYTDEDSDEAHFDQVEEVIYRLHNADLQGDIKKSRFNVQTVNYLGLIIEAGQGVRVDPEKVKAILDWDFKDLRSKTAIRSFLGLCNYIRVFCHHASGTAEPLTRLLKKDAPLDLGPEQKEAFERLKRLAVDTPVLAFFVPGRETKVETDASRNATGGIILQKQKDDTWKPVGYFSKTMTPAERAYPIQDRELLAVVDTLKHYEPELLGTKFFVVTDHQALVYWSSKRLLSTRQVRWADFLANFDITFQYRRGQDNIAADALSRKTANTPTVREGKAEDRTFPLIPSDKIQPVATISIRSISALSEDPDDDIPGGADLVDLIRKENTAQELGYRDGCLVVPETTADGKIFLQTALIREAHKPSIFAHPGQNKTIELLKREYWWSGRNRDIKTYVRNCRKCGHNKKRHDKTPGLLHPLPVPNHVWEQVVVDGKDMPKDEYGYDYVWAFVCKFSRLLATLPGKKNDTAEILAQRYYRALYRFLGVPVSWLSDNAGPFISEFMETINKLTGTKHRHGSSLHPQTQGAVEITNAELDQKLRFYIDKYQSKWSVHLPALDFAHNVAWHSSIGMAPLKVALGTEPRNPLSLPLPEVDLTTDQERKALEIVVQTKAVQDLARGTALKTQAAMELQANKKRREVDFTVDDSVYVSKKGFTTPAPTTRLDSQYAGPWRIIEERGHSFVLDVPASFKGKNLFHADRLRKAADNPLPQQVDDPETPEEINGEPEWEVEKVLASRLFGRTKKLQYQVSWKGCDPDDVWYPASKLKNSSTLLETFHEDYPNAAGPPVRLDYWIRDAAADEFSDDHPDDDKAVRDARGARKKHPTRHK